MIGGPGHASLTAFMKAWPASLAQKPKALLVVSAHWEVRSCTGAAAGAYAGRTALRRACCARWAPLLPAPVWNQSNCRAPALSCRKACQP